ncbi:MAG TPA: Wzz/FepE/Etk N-terminal domain-containing protein [Kofleriaceae bacterium]
MNEAAPGIDLAGVLLQRWRTLAVFGVLGVAAAAAYALLAPPWYAATLTVVPSQRSAETAVASLAAKLPGAFDLVSTDIQRIQGVLNSTSVADEVIDRFHLQERYDERYREHTRRELSEHCGAIVDRKSGLVSLTCEDKVPEQAKAMAEYFGEVGNRVFGRVSTSSAHEERKFLETQVVKARHDVDEASRRLREFQEAHKIVDLPEQSKAVISAMASIKGGLISKQIELSYLSSFSARTEASVVQLQQQIAIMQSKLDQLEDAQQSAAAVGPGSSADAGSASFFPGAMNVPELRFELEQLLREQKIQETVFLLMTQRYELSKVDEARDTSTFQILDHPTLPTYRSRPRRLPILAYGAIAGLALACGWILVPVWWRRRSLAGA